MWWEIITLVLLVLVGCFSFVLLSGAPYVPTLKKQIEVALKLANLSAGKSIIELGCGDGRVMIAAAKQGLNVTGYELNPILFLICWIRVLPYRGQARVIWGNFWRRSWPKADAIYVFLLPKLMGKLEKKIESEQFKRIKVVSFAFRFPNHQPIDEKAGVMLYEFKSLKLR